MFKNAIVRQPCQNMVNGLSKAGLGRVDYQLALVQHHRYVNALLDCGVRVMILPKDEIFPDSTFIEDTAVLTDKCAVITNPGAESRNRETDSVKEAVLMFYNSVEHINAPGTLDGGDIMQAGNHFFVGLSQRTNIIGAEQLSEILSSYGYTSSIIPLRKVLHLKTGVVYLENNNLLAAGEFLNRQEFNKFNIIPVLPDQSYSANCICVNDSVLIASGYPDTHKKLRNTGYRVIELEMSEFRKLDGGLSCLSLRF